MRAWTKDDARASAGPTRITPRPRGDPGDRGLSCARLPRHDPQSPPKAHVPNAIAETSSSALPSGTYRIAISSLRAVLLTVDETWMSSATGFRGQVLRGHSSGPESPSDREQQGSTR